MNILIDMVSISAGGGAEQAIAFLEELKRAPPEGHSYICVVRSGTRIADFVHSNGMQFEVVSNRLAYRVFYTLFGGKALIEKHDIDLVYVCFGIGISVPKKTAQIINVALPVICYWDSPYWKHLGKLDSIRRRIKSKVRAALIKRRATKIVVESNTMRLRLSEVLGLSEDKVAVIPPIRGRVANQLLEANNSAINLHQSGDGITRFLFVTGSDQHKNLWRLIPVSKYLGDSVGSNFLFRITLSEQEFLDSCSRVGGVDLSDVNEKFFHFIGNVYEEDLVRTYSNADVVVNISDLESVSNNYIEAEAAARPMLISKRDYSLGCVRTPFVACEPHSLESLASGLVKCARGEFDSPMFEAPLCISAQERVRRILILAEEVDFT